VATVQRRRFTPDFKIRVVNEALETGNTSAVARRHGIHSSVLNRWISEYKDNGPDAFNGNKKINDKDNAISLQQLMRLERENAQLKKLLGEKDLEIAILRELMKKGSHH
jgi:transposase